MASTKAALALIPARGGSKGVPRKNILPVGGRPLIAWTIEAAKKSGVCTRIIVSTDDPEIAEIAKKEGADVPFMRPADIAKDDTPDYPVFAHAIEWLKKNEKWNPDAVLWLRPTSPLRTADDIRAAFDLFNSTGADAVRSITLTEHHPYWMKTLDAQKRLAPVLDGFDEQSHPRRQTLPPAYHLNGLVDIARVSSAVSNGALFGGDVRGYVTPAERSLELDSPKDIAALDSALNTSDFHVEKLTVNDAEDLSAMILGDTKKYREHFIPFSFEVGELQKRLASAINDQYWGIRVGGTLACLFMLRGFDDGYERPAFGVYVTEKFAGAGLASLALQYAVTWAKLRSTGSMMLKVHPDNTAAKTVYEKAGFVYDSVCDRTGHHIFVKTFRA